MEKEQFLKILRDELIARDITAEAAERHVRSLSLTLSDEDTDAIKKIEDPAEIALLAEGIASVKARSTAEKAEPTAEEPSPDTAQIPLCAETDDENLDDDVKVYNGSSGMPSAPQAHISDEEIKEAVPTDSPAEKAEEKEPIPATPRGRKIFLTTLICTSPLLAVLLAVYFGAFGIGFAALFSVIIASFAALIGGVAAGVTLALVGIVYGIIQLFTEPSSAPGIYEIGLGLCIGGIVMFSAILLYNCAVRLMPWVIRKFKKLFGICTGKLKQLYRSAKEACYKL